MEEKREYCVYKHTSKIDGRAYVGITRVGAENRWRNGGIGYKHQKYFWRYIEKYGWDSLEHEVLFDNLTEEEATAMERELIAKWDLTNKNKGFNLDLGGSTNNHFWRGVYCIETDKEYEGTRIAERETGIHATRICACCSGKVLSAGTDDNGNPLHWVYADEKYLIPKRMRLLQEKASIYAVSVYDCNKTLVAHYENLNDASKATGRISSNIAKDCLHPKKNKQGLIWIYDRDFTEEELDRRIAIINSSFPWEKKVYQYDLRGRFIKTFKSATKAQAEIGVNASDIGMACKGNYSSVGGYLWRYELTQISDDELRVAWQCAHRIPIRQYDLDMNLIAEYDDFTYLPNEYQNRTIKRCCQREFDSAYGYIWRYITDTPEQYELDKQYYSTKTVAKKGYKIAQYTPDGQLVKVFDSFADVEKGGWGRNMVSLCCRGKKDIYRGYIWKYAE
jgi:hypothetical protein